MSQATKSAHKPAVSSSHESAVVNHGNTIQATLDKSLLLLLRLVVVVFQTIRKNLLRRPSPAAKNELTLICDLPVSRRAISSAHADGSLGAQRIQMMNLVLVPEKRLNEAHCAQVVQPNCPVERRAVEMRAVLAERECGDGVAMPAKRAQPLAAGSVPDAYDAVAAAAREPFVVRAEGEGEDLVGVALDGEVGATFAFAVGRCVRAKLWEAFDLLAGE